MLSLVLSPPSLIQLMTPGLALFYGGMTNKRSVVSMMMQSFISLCITDMVWWAYGYSLAFGEDVGGVIGKPNKCFLIGVGLTDPAPQNPKMPEMVSQRDARQKEQCLQCVFLRVVVCT